MFIMSVPSCIGSSMFLETHSVIPGASESEGEDTGSDDRDSVDGGGRSDFSGDDGESHEPRSRKPPPAHSSLHQTQARVRFRQ